ESVLQPLFGGLALQDGEALHHRQAGVDHRSELPGEDGDVTDLRDRPEVEPLGQLDVSAETGLGSLDLADEVTLLPQGRSHVTLAARLHGGGDELASPVACLV